LNNLQELKSIFKDQSTFNNKAYNQFLILDTDGNQNFNILQNFYNLNSNT